MLESGYHDTTTHDAFPYAWLKRERRRPMFLRVKKCRPSSGLTSGHTSSQSGTPRCLVIAGAKNSVPHKKLTLLRRPLQHVDPASRNRCATQDEVETRNRAILPQTSLDDASQMQHVTASEPVELHSTTPTGNKPVHERSTLTHPDTTPVLLLPLHPISAPQPPQPPHTHRESSPREGVDPPAIRVRALSHRCVACPP